MAVTIRTYRVRPSTDFVEEWYKVIEYFRLGRPHRFLESVWNQYLDKTNRDLSSKQIIDLPVGGVFSINFIKEFSKFLKFL